MKKLKKTLEDGKILAVHGLAELILWKWPSHWKEPAKSVQFPSKSQWHYSQKWKINLKMQKEAW
jgi:hypothetical protein